MLVRSLVAASLLAAGSLAPSLVAAGDAPKPLRTLVYDVTYSAHSIHDKRTSGFNGAYGNGTNSGPSSVSAGNGTASIGLDGSDRGQLTVEVIAAPPSGGLVVDTAYTGRLSTQPRLRVVLFDDGRMSADPHAALGPESVHLLPLLARGFIANRDVSPGSTWTVDVPPPGHGKIDFRVSHVNGAAATLSYEGSMTVPGVAGFDEVDRGTTEYATDLLSPTGYDLVAHIRRQIGTDETITTDAHWTLTLVHDTFAKR
ncbi:hypothetical protein WPS_29050 [Vulcanimicrobium alpinum]|uniref:DUF4198 domain-containing protein n=1 Tax=Vulcanimicrobium alpinum TaxID=3016050 RepID=A0AAN1XZ55_UNVUL|nr:hypothetical protein [Vulcanimicrobium alpinum]BDE07629.1 hypothetical protein WPS_29050 [Vulcanimicrobium alpinum]